MAPHQTEKSSLKRQRNSAGEPPSPKKHQRRSARLSHLRSETENTNAGGLPSPVTRKETTDTENESTNIDSQQNGKATTNNRDAGPQRTPTSSPQPPSQSQRQQYNNVNANSGLSSPPSDTQPYSQFLAPAPISYEVEDEEKEGVWGYLIPTSGTAKTLVLRQRGACPVDPGQLGVASGRQKVNKSHWQEKERKYEREKTLKGIVAGGYLIGRHPECDRMIDALTVSNRHCLLFHENKDGDALAVLEDLSANGTYVNDAYIGRNKRRELQDGDEISIVAEARFVFRYPRNNRDSNAFRQQYTIQGQLGKGHFATVYLATEKSTGMRYAVKKFEKRSGPGERSKIDGLQQEIAVLMGVSHPNMLCLKDTFDEADGVYLVLELAPEGELFNWIVMKHKLSEEETRKIFIQLFQGVKYLHERNIVHRDIKPENILLLTKTLHIKLADFGLAKIIGEESFTTTLCGTPSYVAPEILENSNHRRYTRAVDIWSLGVVLYICLCGFPPFSDELYTKENPWTLSQQIRAGRFDYPSPYWDSVGDEALDLIDRMLTVDFEKRIDVEGCLRHPWITLGQEPPDSQTASQSQDAGKGAMSMTDSTDGLTGALAGLDFSKRKVRRERTLLSAINDVKIERVIESQADDGTSQPVKVWEKNTPDAARENGHAGTKGKVETTIEPEPEPEACPDDLRDPKEFAAMGGKGDEVLFDDAGDVAGVPETEEGESRYPDASMTSVKAGAPPDQ